MTKQQELEKKISEAAYFYYKGQAIMPDSAFDKLLEELKQIAPDSNILKTVGWGGGEYLGRFKSKHFGNQVIGSLEKVQFGNEYGSNHTICTPKLDGGSVVVTYQNGKPISAITRGDGREGQNVLSKLVHQIPAEIPCKSLISVRGEAFIMNEAFEELKEAGVPNPRNYVSGILNRDKINDPELRYITFLAYSIVCTDNDNLPKTKREVLETLKQYGFSVPLMYEVNYNDLEQISYIYKECQSLYPIDGLVFTDNLVKSQNEEGLNNYIEDSIAYKFPGESAKTTVRGVVWTTGNSGRVNPVVQFDSVFLEGSNISNASGYNLRFLSDMGIKEGVQVSVRKANGIIPEIFDSNAEEKGVNAPSNCPSCGSVLRSDGVFLICDNQNCIARHSASLYRLFDICNIPFGLSSTTIDKLIAREGYGSLISFISSMKDKKAVENEVSKVFGTGHYGQLMQQLIENIDTRLKAGLAPWEFWYIQNLTNLGSSNSKKIIETPDEFIKSGNLDKTNIPYNAKDAILANKEVIKELFQLITSLSNIVITEEAHKVKICYTGKTDKFKTRKEFFNFYKNKAEEVPIAKADFLICNVPSNSSKYQYATSHNIKILTEAEASQFLNNKK